MTLVAHALAICATGALAEVLPAWTSVVLNPHDPLALVDGSDRIIVAVFAGDARLEVKGRRWTTGDATVELVVQVLLPPTVAAEVGGVSCTFDTRKGGESAIYAVVCEAIRYAFTAPEPGTWGELLQRVWLSHPEPIDYLPGRAERTDSIPVPVLDISIPCEVIQPPAPGTVAPEPWPQIVAQMRADTAFTPAGADFLEALIAGRPLSPVDAELALAGLSRIEGPALGLGGLPGGEDWPPASRLTIETPCGDLVVEGAPAPGEEP